MSFFLIIEASLWQVFRIHICLKREINIHFTLFLFYLFEHLGPKKLVKTSMFNYCKSLLSLLRIPACIAWFVKTWRSWSNAVLSTIPHLRHLWGLYLSDFSFFSFFVFHNLVEGLKHFLHDKLRLKKVLQEFQKP